MTDTLYSKRIDGIYCRVMKTGAAEKAVKNGLDLPAAFVNSRKVARQMKMPYLKLLIGILASGLGDFVFIPKQQDRLGDLTGMKTKSPRP